MCVCMHETPQLVTTSNHHNRGTICFAGGIFLVLIGWAFIGMVVEVFGILNLFG